MIKHVFFDRRRMLPILLLALLIAITCLFFGCALKKPRRSSRQLMLNDGDRSGQLS